MARRARALALFFGWAFGGGLAAPAGAAELTVYSAGAVEAGLGPLMEAFRRESGHAVRLTVAVPNLLRQRVEAGEAPDVLIAPVPVMDALARAGALRDAPRETVGKVGVAVVVRTGARGPTSDGEPAPGACWTASLGLPRRPPHNIERGLERLARRGGVPQTRAIPRAAAV